MIIKGLRVRTRWGVGRLVRHLWEGDENEAIEVIRGTISDVKDMQADARSHGARFSVRHWIISPHENISREHFQKVVERLSSEFGFEAARAVIVEHRKKRATKGAADRHWHILVGELDPATGKILRSSFDRVLHELVARWSEYDFESTFTLGRHTKSVLSGLRERGLGPVASGLEVALGAIEGRPAEAFTHSQHQRAKRLAIDLPALKRDLRELFATSVHLNALRETIAKHGLRIAAGDKRNTWIVVSSEEETIGALHRLAGQKKAVISALMATEAPARSVPLALASNDEDIPHFVCSEEMQGDSISDDLSEPTVEKDDRAMVSDAEDPESVEQAAQLKGKSVSSELWRQLSKLENSARAELRLEFPKKLPTPEVSAMKEASRKARHDADREFDSMWEASERLRTAPRPVWWAYLLGIAWLRKSNIDRLEMELEEAEKRLSERRDISGQAAAALLTAERRAADQHRRQVSEIAERQKRARKNLAKILTVREFLRSHPEAVNNDLPQIFHLTEMSIRKKRGISSGADKLGHKAPIF